MITAIHRLLIGWSLRDTRGQARILARLDRVEEGLFGDHKNLGQGIWELRFSFGPGYRIYYGLDGRTVVLLLCGGDKSSQKSDIKLARQYWQRYCRLRGRDQELGTWQSLRHTTKPATNCSAIPKRRRNI